MKSKIAVLFLLMTGCAAETDEFEPDDTVEVEVLDEALLSMPFSSAASKLGVTLRYQFVPSTGQVEAMTTPLVYKKHAFGGKIAVVSKRVPSQYPEQAYHDLCLKMSGQVLTNYNVWPNKTLNLTNYIVTP